MAIQARILCAFILALVALAGCGGGDDGADGNGPPTPIGIGPAGGTVLGPNGAKAVIPAGAVATNLDIRVEQTSSGAPPLPGDLVAVGSMFAFTPHGTTFAAPVTITLPFDPAAAPSTQPPALYKTNAQNQWEPIANASFGADAVSAEISSFSFAQVVIPPLQRNDPVREWNFTLLMGDGAPATAVPGPDGSGTQTGGLLERIVTVGPIAIDGDMTTLTGVVPPDDVASAFVFGTPDGVTYGVFAEAPFGKLGGINQPGDPEPIGAIARLDQRQSFIKRAADATLSYTVSATSVCAYDYNLFPPTFGMTDAQTPVRGLVTLDVMAWTRQPQRTFYSVAGSAYVTGTRNAWSQFVQVFASGFSHDLWDDSNFDFEVVEFEDEFGDGTEACLILARSITHHVDLSTVAIGEEFTLRSVAEATAENYRGGGAPGDHQASGVYAYLRDPSDIGGSTITFSGLEPTNRPDLVLPSQAPVVPAACTTNPSPDPEASVLQFSSANFSLEESSAQPPTITVTRTGGSRGAATATFATSGGTAIEGVDYTATAATVFFPDGDSSPRVVQIPVLDDEVVETDKTIELMLSQPGGCTSLGAQVTTTITLRDNDEPPPTGTPGVLDATFGTAGEATMQFGGDRSAMALQADGKIVIAGGTFTDFILARFNADGTEDSTFGNGGRVTTDLVTGEQEEALGVAIQPDGKIVVVGYTGTAGPGGPSNVALARYNLDGSLDATFGVEGKITSGVAGRAYAVAVQPDGRIVVAGEVDVSSNSDFSDFLLARYNANGALDPTFNADGIAITDIVGGTNTARNLALLSNGAILASGEPIGTFNGSDHTDIVRYDENGNPDASFGSAGVVTLAGARVGEGLALQSDGKIVLAGSASGTAPALSQFSVRRLNANGTIDASFGEAGTASVSFTTSGDAALAVAIHPDGKILVAGYAGLVNANFGLARFNSNGTLDTSFANGGKITVDFSGGADIAESVAVQPNGRIVLGGLANGNGYGLARVLASGP